jgi:hypothetical protein
VYDADIIINGLPSTETRNVFERIARVWNATRDRSQADPVVVSLSKGVETSLEPHPHIITPTRVIHEVTGVPLSNLLYLGKPVTQGGLSYFLHPLQYNLLSCPWLTTCLAPRHRGPQHCRRGLAGRVRQCPHLQLGQNAEESHGPLSSE